VTISLDVNGEIPKKFPTASATRFRLVVEETAWSVTVWRRGACFQFAKTSGARAAVIDDSLALTAPKLRNVRAWLRDVEAQIGAAFRRDRPNVHSNVAGATAALKKWLVDPMS
jgi:hypothetical protein